MQTKNECDEASRALFRFWLQYTIKFIQKLSTGITKAYSCAGNSGEAIAAGLSLAASLIAVGTVNGLN